MSGKEDIKTEQSCALDKRTYEEYMDGLIIFGNILLCIFFIYALEKNYSPMLFFIMTIIMCYVLYSTYNIIPTYVAPIIGLLIYMVDIILQYQHYKKSSGITDDIIVRNLWKIPFWAIIGQYTIVMSQILQKN